MNRLPECTHNAGFDLLNLLNKVLNNSTEARETVGSPQHRWLPSRDVAIQKGTHLALPLHQFLRIGLKLIYLAVQLEKLVKPLLANIGLPGSGHCAGSGNPEVEFDPVGVEWCLAGELMLARLVTFDE